MIKVHSYNNHSKINIENIDLKDHDIHINEPHTHNFFEIGYFEESEGLHTVDFTQYPIKGNTIYFLKKGIVHSLFRKQGSSGKVISFHEDVFNDSSLKQKLLFTEPHVYLENNQFIFFKQLVIQLENYLLNEHSKIELIENYLQLILSFYENYAVAHVNVNEKIHDFLAYLELNYSAKLTVDSCISNLNISYQQLYNEVHKKLNKTPIDLIKERLILQAKRLLFNTEFSIKEIAYELDFEDASYFSKYFKSHTGENPLTFRVQSRT